MTKLFRIAAAALTLATFASAANAETLRRYEFDVIWSIFPELQLATGKLVLEDNGADYKMGMEAKAVLAVPRVSWKGFFATEGKISGKSRRPALFERRTESLSRKERAVIAWKRRGRAPETRLDAGAQGAVSSRDRVDPRKVSSKAVDPLTFLARIMDEVHKSDGKKCNLRMTTWDGVRLADIEIRRSKQEPGKWIECRVLYRNIKGLPDVDKFVAKEGETVRIVRFEKRDENWDPVWLKIKGEFGGFDSTFTTTVRPID